MRKFLLACAILAPVTAWADAFSSVAPAGSQTQTTATGATASRALGDRAADVVNVKDGYGGAVGAKGDGKQKTTAISNSAGTPTILNVSGANFTAADIGKSIFVAGIGVAGAELATTITAVNSTSQVVLATAASTFVSTSKQVTWGTDDSAAINAAFTYARTLVSAAAGSAVKVVLPQGLYVVQANGINATSLLGMIIDGAGATIYAATSGVSAFDALLAYGVEIYGLKIVGDCALPPTTGIQMGRIASGLAATGRNIIRNVQVYGCFSLTAAYSMGSETTQFEQNNFNTSTAGTYAFIDDGVNHFSLTSQYKTITLPANTPFTSTNTIHNGDKFVASGAGSSALWMSNAQSRSFWNTYFFAPAYGVVLYQTNGARNVSVKITGTVEGITDTVFITGDNAQALTQFSIEVSATNATNSFFLTDTNVTSVNCYRCEAVAGGGLQGAAVGFTAPTIWTWDGNVYSSTSTGWTMPTNFQGFTDFGLVRTYAGGQGVSFGTSASVSNGAALAMGSSAIADGSNSVAMGGGSHSSGTGSFALGTNAFTARFGNECFSSGFFSANGDAQSCVQMLRAASSSTSAVRLTANAGAAGATNNVNVPPTFQAAYLVELRMVGRDTVTGDAAYWTSGPFLVKVGANASTMVLVGSPAFTAGSNTGGGCLASIAAPTIAADTTNGGLNISVTPMNSDACHWVVEARTPVEVK